MGGGDVDIAGDAAERQEQLQQNKAVIRRFVEEVQNKNDWAAYDELNDPSVREPQRTTRDADGP